MINAELDSLDFANAQWKRHKMFTDRQNIYPCEKYSAKFEITLDF